MKSSNFLLYLIVALAVVALALFVISKSPAATMERRCVIANQDCFVLRAAAGGRTAIQRMALVNDRLAAVLGVAKSEDINARFLTGRSGDVAVLCGSSLIVTVTRADALAAGVATQADLAKVWATNIATALLSEDVTPATDQSEGPIALRSK